MKDLEKEAIKLSTQNSWVRTGAKKLMDEWAKRTEGEEFKGYAGVTVKNDDMDTEDRHYQTVVDEYKYYLHTGQTELKAWDDCYGEYIEIDGYYHFTDILPMSQLRGFLKIFPVLCLKTQEAMRKKEEENTDLILYLKKQGL